MSLTSGTRIGVFQIVAKLGAGGMGEVYRAHDTRLDRDVALKVLPDLFTSDPERLARFEREAKVLAALNHPNIAQVYGFEPPEGPGGRAAIAMELVEGQTLQDLLAAHAGETGVPGLPLERALALARQIATALEAAHEQGIIHRDLKPANISVRDDGTVKVLDFGLAKAFAADAESAHGVAHSPTLTARSTQLGMILGTAAYMSPEQAKGRVVDRRADVWAFGAILFEMLTGRRAFEGDDVSDVLASVLKSDPEWHALPPALPPAVRRLLRRCLEKDPKKRLRDIGEGMLQLDEGLTGGAVTSGITAADPSRAAAGPPPRSLARRAAPIAATAAATAVIVATMGVLWMPPAPPPPLTARALHVPAENAPFFPTIGHSDVAISFDGRTIAYSVGTGAGTAATYLRRLDEVEARPLRGAQPAVGAFFSPDGEWVGFVDQTAQEQIRKVSVLGGPALPVVARASQVLGASWTSDGIIYGGREGPLYHVASSGGTPVPLTTLDTASGETAHLWPSAVPGTTVVLFVAATGDLGTRFVAASGSLGTRMNTQLAAIDRASGRTVRFGIDGSSPRYVASGHIVYATADGSLRAVSFDPGRLRVGSGPVPVAEGIGVKITGAANFDVSATGHLVYTGAGSTGAARTLAWVDRAGRETPIPAPARNYFYARVSPDGSRLSLDVRDEEEDVWIWDVRRETLARLTDRPGADQYGLWTPDHRIVFSSAALGRFELFRHRPDAVGQPEQITDTTAEKVQPFPNAVTPDGKQVIFRSQRDGPKSDLFVAEMTGEKRVRPLLATEHDERNAALSPDGAYMAFESDVTGGRMEIYVRPFPDVDSAQYKVSTDGGAEPVWSPDGREIFYLSGGKLMAVPVSRTRGLELGRPVALFDVRPYFFGGAGRNYDVAPDGRRFVMVKNAADQQNRSAPITIVLNWIGELRGRVASKP
ncbi:MAG TPA: protein kinase [Vicinamibacterales bacterium]|nr:protein kinase [Vicinamibacterales bacterium]